MLIAVVWNGKGFRGRNIAVVLYLLPAVISIVAISVVFRILYDQSVGPIDAIITAVGLPSVPWLSDEAWARIGIAIVRLWESVGLGALFYFASLQSIPPEIYDAADVDGCGPIHKFWSITIPLLMRTTLFLTVINTLAVFSLFAEPQNVTNDGGPNNATTTVGLYLYHLVQNLDYGTASAVSFLATVGMMIISIALFFAESALGERLMGSIVRRGGQGTHRAGLARWADLRLSSCLDIHLFIPTRCELSHLAVRLPSPRPGGTRTIGLPSTATRHRPVGRSGWASRTRRSR